MFTPLATTLALLLAPTVGAAPATRTAPVTLGVDVLLDGPDIALLAGKRVGLITNASGVDGDLVPTADRLAADPRVNLVQLYAPEHGLRGALAAGEKIKDTSDPVTGLPVQALFGARRRPTAASLKGVDVLVFDIQDVGSRTYTYVSTMGEAMHAAAEANLPFVVLDRPNPLGGVLFEGPIREDKRKSFVGWGPVPVTHGLTIGELAKLYNAELKMGVDLHVVPMKGWQRAMTWHDTGLHWVPTSPGIPRSDSAPLYVATGMFGGVSTNVNEGVGTTQPFEMIGAEWMDAQALWKRMTAARLPGVIFRPITYRPYYHRFRKQLLHGVQLIITDPHRFRPLRTAIALIAAVEALYPKQVALRSKGYVARIWGIDGMWELVRASKGVAAIEAAWGDDLAAFAKTRERFLLYR